MFDLSKATKSQLVTLVQEIQSYAGEKSLAASTLARSRNEDLVTRIQTFLFENTDRGISEEGHLELTKPEPPVVVVDKAVLAGICVDGTANPAKGRGRTPAHSDDAVITVTVEKIPGREGSAAFARASEFRSGQTVGAFLAAAGVKGRRTLRKALRKGWVVVN